MIREERRGWAAAAAAAAAGATKVCDFLKRRLASRKVSVSGGEGEGGRERQKQRKGGTRGVRGVGWGERRGGGEKIFVASLYLQRETGRFTSKTA